MWSVAYIIETSQGTHYNAAREFPSFAAAYDATLFPESVLALAHGDSVVWHEIKERVLA